MANYSWLKKVLSDLYNADSEITWETLLDSFNTFINDIADGRLFIGVATPATDPGLPDPNVYYLTSESGYYSFFGTGVPADSICAIINTGSTWQTIKIADNLSSSAITNIAEAAVVRYANATFNKMLRDSRALSFLEFDGGLRTLPLIQIKDNGDGNYVLYKDWGEYRIISSYDITVNLAPYNDENPYSTVCEVTPNEDEVRIIVYNINGDRKLNVINYESFLNKVSSMSDEEIPNNAIVLGYYFSTAYSTQVFFNGRIMIDNQEYTNGVLKEIEFTRLNQNPVIVERHAWEYDWQLALPTDRPSFHFDHNEGYIYIYRDYTVRQSVAPGAMIYYSDEGISIGARKRAIIADKVDLNDEIACWHIVICNGQDDIIGLNVIHEMYISEYMTNCTVFIYLGFYVLSDLWNVTFNNTIAGGLFHSRWSIKYGLGAALCTVYFSEMTPYYSDFVEPEFEVVEVFCTIIPAGGGSLQYEPTTDGSLSNNGLDFYFQIYLKHQHYVQGITLKLFPQTVPNADVADPFIITVPAAAGVIELDDKGYRIGIKRSVFGYPYQLIKSAGSPQCRVDVSIMYMSAQNIKTYNISKALRIDMSDPTIIRQKCFFRIFKNEEREDPYTIFFVTFLLTNSMDLNLGAWLQLSEAAGNEKIWMKNITTNVDTSERRSFLREHSTICDTGWYGEFAFEVPHKYFALPAEGNPNTLWAGSLQAKVYYSNPYVLPQTPAPTYGHEKDHEMREMEESVKFLEIEDWDIHVEYYDTDEPIPVTQMKAEEAKKGVIKKEQRISLNRRMNRKFTK